MARGIEVGGGAPVNTKTNVSEDNPFPAIVKLNQSRTYEIGVKIITMTASGDCKNIMGHSKDVKPNIVKSVGGQRLLKQMMNLRFGGLILRKRFGVAVTEATQEDLSDKSP